MNVLLIAPGFPAALGPGNGINEPEDPWFIPKRRKALAEWLTSPEHPLVAEITTDACRRAKKEPWRTTAQVQGGNAQDGCCRGAPTPSALMNMILCAAQFKGHFDTV